MRIHRVNGKSLRDALERARALHGERAVVLSHESTSIGVTVAVVDPPRASGAGSPSPALAEPARRDPGIVDVERRLSRAGASSAWVARVVEGLERRRARGIGAIDAAAEELERTVAIAPSPKLGDKPCVLAFVGPTGVGKTTTLAKLAARLVGARRRVALIGTDTERAGGVEHLQAHAKLLQAPFHVARDAAALADLVQASRGVDAVLIDTAGHSPRDARTLETTVRALERAGQAHALIRYLVLSAAASSSALQFAHQSFAVLDPTALVLTKLDETREPGPAIELAARAKLPLAFLCDGQDVARDLHRAQAAHVADLMLRGRLS